LQDYNYQYEGRKKMIVLGIETATECLSAALLVENKKIYERRKNSRFSHCELLTGFISELVDEAGIFIDTIDCVVVSVGPGSFTGLRIAVTLAKTMHLANAAKIVAVDTLDVIAANKISLTTENTVQHSSHESRATGHERIAPILDAKRGRFFIAVYQRNTSDKRQATSDGTWKKLFPDSLMTASQFLDQFACDEKPILLLGDGLLYYKGKFKADTVRFLDEKYWSPRASKVHLLGWKKALTNQFADPLTLTPNYLLSPDIKVKTR